MLYLKFQPPAFYDPTRAEEPLRARNAKEEMVLGEVNRLIRGGFPHFVAQGNQQRRVCPNCGALVAVICGPDFGDGAGPLQIASHACGGEG